MLNLLPPPPHTPPGSAHAGKLWERRLLCFLKITKITLDYGVWTAALHAVIVGRRNRDPSTRLKIMKTFYVLMFALLTFLDGRCMPFVRHPLFFFLSTNPIESRALHCVVVLISKFLTLLRTKNYFFPSQLMHLHKELIGMLCKVTRQVWAHLRCYG